jgi:Sulfotransferase family
MAMAVVDAPFARHVVERTVVLPRERVLFLPMPKAGCTGVLWLLSQLAGIAPQRFERSPLPEVSPAMTVHDMNLWEPEHRLSSYGGAELERVLGEDGWLRFTIVRDPGPRLWSGWQSKLLLREPRFVEAFGSAAWFPRVPEEPEQVVRDFRAFVAALAAGEGEDVHWAVQHDLVAQLPLDHVGRVEDLEATLEALRAHTGRPLPATQARRENRTPLDAPEGLYDAAAAGSLRERFAADHERFGYAPPVAGDGAIDPGWVQRVAPLLPLLAATIDEHARLGQLQRIAQRRMRRAQSAEERLEAVGARQAGTACAPAATNLEGHTDFNVRWGWAEGPVAPGFTAVVRVRDEARSLPWVLPPLLRAVGHVVLLDNGSTDGTVEVARAVAEHEGAAARLEVHHYPFAVARCGDEHLGTPAGSVHSLAYFYNWSFAHVRTGYALKWDGDMVLADSAVAALRDLAWQLEASEVVVRVPRYPLYLVDERRAFVDTALRNTEPWGWPNRPGYSFVKAMDWELPLWEPGTPTITLPDWSCVELKHLDADEFAHWSHTDFDASARTSRKRREWEVFHALAGGGAAPDGVVEVRAPAGRHVVEHVRDVWLPQRAGRA